MDIAEIFEQRKDDSRWNTSYPLSPDDWEKFRVESALSFDKEDELSFYIHIPFCKRLCSFCEYTRMICPSEEYQYKYIAVIANDIASFKERYKNFKLNGFDIGGGTPTSLSENEFDRLMDVYDNAIKGIGLADNYEPSIEATFDTLSENKLQRIVKSGIKRLSLGIQSSCQNVLSGHNRCFITPILMKETIDKAHSIGIQKVNIDLMYGLNGQTLDSIKGDLKLIEYLKAEQVTLYELRTNMISCKEIPTKELLFNMYGAYFDGLMRLGYFAHFGQNTFSKNHNDCGVSSYLRSRMFDGKPYKGFGISAQSMNLNGVSYNVGKNILRFDRLLNRMDFPEEYTYILPQRELTAKYLAISAYSGSFKLSRLNRESKSVKEALAFCLDKDLLSITDDVVRITRKGFKYYGAVFSLFYKSL